MANIKESFLNKNLLTIGMSVLGIGIVLVLFAPLIFTKLPVFLDLTSTGEIGDSIAGMTSPIIGILSAVLIFLSLFAQIQANRTVVDELGKEAIERQRNEGFRTLTEFIQTQSKEFENLTERTIDGHNLTGSLAARRIIQLEHSGNESKYFPLLVSIARNLLIAVQMSDEFKLSKAQDTMIAIQVLAAATKVNIPLMPLNLEKNSDTSLNLLWSYIQNVLEIARFRAGELTVEYLQDPES